MASFTVMEMVLGSSPEVGEMTAQPDTAVCQPCSIVCGVTGPIEGQVIYGMSETTANRIAEVMLQCPISSFDELAVSALAELTNMISGNAAQYLSESGVECDITPPTVLTGDNIKFHRLKIPAAVVPITHDVGCITITVGLKARQSAGSRSTVKH